VLQSGLQLSHRSTGLLELSVPAPLEDHERGEAPELITVRESGESATRQDWVFLADGYRLEERDSFLADIEENLAHMEQVEPYSRYMPLVNVWALFLPSAESGADHLELDPPTYADTPLGCHYGAYGIDRLLDCDGDAVLAASSHAPGEDVRIVLVNDPTYGGSGAAAFAVSFNGKEMVQAVAHEMAHSDGNLADEYDYGMHSSEGLWGTEFPNCSASPDPTPWEHWILAESDGVGAFSPCSYSDYFRPTDEACMMNILQDTFCVVCRESLVRTIYGHLDRLIQNEASEPLSLEEGGSLVLSVEVLDIAGSPLHATWLREAPDGSGAPPTLLADGGGLFSHTLDWTDFDPGVHTVTVRVEDLIDWVLVDRPLAMEDEYSFSIHVAEPSVPTDDDDASNDDDAAVGGNEDTGCSACEQSGPRSRAGAGGLLLLGLALLSCRARRGSAGTA